MRVIVCNSSSFPNRLLAAKGPGEIYSVAPELYFTITFLLRTPFRRKKILLRRSTVFSYSIQAKQTNICHGLALCQAFDPL